MFAPTKCILAVQALFALSAISASAQNVDKINKWFDAQNGKTYEIQRPGAVQTAPSKVTTLLEGSLTDALK